MPEAPADTTVPPMVAAAVAGIAAAAADAVSTDDAVASAPRTSEVAAASSRRAARAARLATGEQPVQAQEPVAEPEGETYADLVFDEPFLQEPVFVAEPEVDFVAEPFTADLDEFEAAARLFSFTAETPIQESAAPEAAAEQEPADESLPAPVAAVRSRGASFRRLATASFSIGVVGVVGLMAVGMTTPAQALAAASGNSATLSVLAPSGGDVAAEDSQIQAYVAPSTVENVAVARSENYEMVSMAQIAADEGITNTSDFYVNDPTSNIQWPFAVGVPITYGFGWRSGAMHEGADFVPGEGAPVQAIADGTVRIATESGGAYGVTVVLDHIVDGQLVSTRYGHMLYGSLKVSVGQRVTVGTVLGNTGNTGRSFGAHTHVEVLLNGTTPTDPIVWLRKYTDGTHEVG
ncbi:M23 family metallopeptidase [Microbacterium terricola]|uniref:M23ase beta-sheet core domain-containing protein n=1 Tax=Microbacterium terricola TaxID=344163 RepID=A0ABM8E1H5_9MICO|nr:M23 family metallopeptidase [Microbacterium terricola]UYK40631.1 M23 family metallopeptidase [Microbacterium terricola]BDV31636.1 hypothetical protein Microterr_22960 [Microbacterium terricola]